MILKRKIDKTMFIKAKDFSLELIYWDDIKFGTTNELLCKEFPMLMSKKIKITVVRELNFFLG